MGSPAGNPSAAVLSLHVSAFFFSTQEKFFLEKVTTNSALPSPSRSAETPVWNCGASGWQLGKEDYQFLERLADEAGSPAAN